MDNEAKANRKIAIGMLLVTLAGIIIGGCIGYIASSHYLNNDVLKQLLDQGYVITSDATASADDILAGKSAYINGVLVEGTKEVVDTSDATAKAEYILKGKKAYINGVLVEGTLESYSLSKPITPSTGAANIPENVYLSSDIIVDGDSDLAASNIRKGVWIFNICGTYDPYLEGPEASE